MADDFPSCGFTVVSVRQRIQRKTVRIFSSQEEEKKIHQRLGYTVPSCFARFRLAKFLGDTLFAAVGCLCLLPFFVVVALLIFSSTGRNPFFLQTRVGKGGKHFRILKFKTMDEKRDEWGNLLPDKLRVTKIGDFLRRTSLDELPQLLNVLKGDMSLIGPRPWIPEQMEIFTPHEREYRCRVKPGITGLAQVYGRNGLTFRKRLPYDIWYVRYLSLPVDLMILWKTVGKVLKRDGIQQRKDALVSKSIPFLNGKRELNSIDN